MIIDKRYNLIALFASRDPTRRNLYHVRANVEAGRFEATNGHVTLIAPFPEGPEPVEDLWYDPDEWRALVRATGRVPEGIKPEGVYPYLDQVWPRSGEHCAEPYGINPAYLELVGKVAKPWVRRSKGGIVVNPPASPQSPIEFIVYEDGEERLRMCVMPMRF